jgi:hypothetical protein
MIEVLPTADRRAEADALVKVFSLLIADLERIDRNNQQAEPGTPTGGVALQARSGDRIEALRLTRRCHEQGVLPLDDVDQL